MRELFGLFMEYVLNALRPIQYRLLLIMQRFEERVRNIVNSLTIGLSIIGIGNVIWQIGFETSPESIPILQTINNILIYWFGCVQIYRLINGLLSERRVELWQLAYMAVIWAYIICVDRINGAGWLSHRYIVDTIVVILSTYELSTLSISFLTRKSSPTMLFAGSFVIFIVIGTGLLLMPRCHYDDMTLLQAVFTSTSSVCVSGLSVIDIGRAFTPFGQAVVMVLIQVGGLGVMTFTCFFALSLTGKGSLQNRMFIKDLISADNMSDIFQTLKHIMYVTFLIEGVSAWSLYYHFREALPGMPIHDVIFTSVFHAISAFCNAGISNLPDGLLNPAILHNNGIHMVIAVTVIFGGAGFPLQSAAINWVKNHAKRLFFRILGKKEYARSNRTRIINASNRLTFYSHITLLIFGTIAFLILEAGRSQAGASLINRLIDSFFMSASARTAGFMFMDLLTESGSSIVVLMLLMWIGCAPMSTGGGMKVTTFAICVLNARNVLIGKDCIEIFGRRISTASIHKAHATMTISFGAVVISTIAMKIAMPEVDTIRLFFESFSALSTVGLTMDLTPTLNTACQLILIGDMFLGRIGVMAFLMIFITPGKHQRYKYPSENIMI
ncbi:MAG: hypothetical protein MR215_02680 [Bacteroidales bacterium]|nr:hypothetical protein [Bacteroidales bacterium]MDY4175514.1 potassium transporter TrkG [Bacteroidales bacterium]